MVLKLQSIKSNTNYGILFPPFKGMLSFTKLLSEKLFIFESFETLYERLFNQV